MQKDKEQFFERIANSRLNEDVRRGSQAVIYTRVSSKEQMESGDSLDTQKRYCEEYARKKGLQVAAYFGGTYESAKSDERKEFNKMLSYVKRHKSISYIIVYSYDRFSRTGTNGAYISEQLQKQGVATISVTQEIDTKTPSGSFQQNLYYLFSQFDNELRKEKCTTGMREKLKQGYWCWSLPTGYTNLNQGAKADKQKLILNNEGKLIKKAFQWKLKENLPNHLIIKKLHAQGFKISDQQLSKCLRNPFYCGILINKILPGEVIEGRHEKAISVEAFLKVQAILGQSPKSGVKTQPGHEAIPLKMFVHCDECGEPYTGYVVKAKGIYYYKCRTKGCAKNKNAKKLNERFKEFLKGFSLSEHLQPLFEQTMLKVITEMNQEALEDQHNVKKEFAALNKKVESIEKRFVFGEIDAELYNKYIGSLKEEQALLARKLEEGPLDISNLQKTLSKSCDLMRNIHSMWHLADFDEKGKIQNLIFPDGIDYVFKNDTFRTRKVNSFFKAINCVPSSYTPVKTKKPADVSAGLHVVHSQGFEPRTS